MVQKSTLMSRPSRRSCLRPCSTLGPQGLKRQLQVIPCSYPPSHRLVTICHTATGTLGLPPCSWVRAGRKTSLPQSCAGVSRECGRHHMCRGALSDERARRKVCRGHARRSYPRVEAVLFCTMAYRVYMHRYSTFVSRSVYPTFGPPKLRRKGAEV